jgi:hypothetical protein
MVERRVSSNCRTIRWPVFAVDFQWICRWASPVAYSRTACRGHRDGHGVDVQRPHVRPAELASQQLERIGASGRGGAHVEDTAAPRRNDNLFGMLPPAPQQRNVKVKNAIANRNVDAPRKREPRLRAAHHDRASRRLARDNGIVFEREVHLIGLAAEQEG